MIIDVQELLSDSQALTASGASTNYKDHRSARSIGDGEPMALVIQVEVAADVASTDETYQFDLQFDDNSSFSSPRIVLGRAFTTAQATAELKVGSKVVIPLPKDATARERYMRMYATLGGTTPSITFSAWVCPMSMVENTVYYPDDRVGPA